MIGKRPGDGALGFEGVNHFENFGDQRLRRIVSRGGVEQDVQRGGHAPVEEAEKKGNDKILIESTHFGIILVVDQVAFRRQAVEGAQDGDDHRVDQSGTMLDDEVLLVAHE